MLPPLVLGQILIIFTYLWKNERVAPLCISYSLDLGHCALDVLHSPLGRILDTY